MIHVEAKDTRRRRKERRLGSIVDELPPISEKKILATRA
jgi:hypothetical protein